MSVKRLWSLCAVAAVAACGTDDSRPLSMNALYENPNAAGFLRADKVVPIQFPRDHGEHLDFQTEWWYVVGVVSDEDQREFGFQFTLFRQALTPSVTMVDPWRTGQIYMAHFAVSDIDLRNHVAFERFSRGHPKLAGVSTVPFKAFVEEWALQSINETYSPLHLRTQADGYALDLNLEMTKAPVLHGEDGLSWKSPTNASYYYSVPRMETSGTLTTPERSFQVRGHAWIDREWSTGILDESYRGWNWLTIHLDDGQELVLFNLVPRTNDVEVMPVGMLIGKEGQRTRLQPDTWRLIPIRHWRSWPVGWQLEVSGRTLVIEPAFDEQLMSTSVRYWEGVVFVYEGDRRVGEGYLELTGY